ncbi:hypothetical protein D9757_006794 [Collybiopsis confluens]|uniref:Transmembrane protein n=1 Tax=Collybiopsis confluens TaxID=2823264 RepID=A0A8H5HLQ6_9AGAR|nr:hypothetical protein D9757_006794 [Collybiopsis confluens]
MLLTKPGAWHTVFAVFWLLTNARLASASESNPQVQWISPSAGDAFSTSDSILAKWSADTTVVSPVFKLCLGEPQSSFGSRSEEQGDDSSCGSKVYPTVQQSAGTYSTSLAVPNATQGQHWHLEMSDDFENTWSSPAFSLSSSGYPSVASVEGSQFPVSIPPASTVAIPATSVPVEVASSSSATPMLATRTPPPTAAFAIPLSIVAVILLVAAFLSFRHNRKLAQERAQDLEKMILSRKSSNASSVKSEFSRQSDIEHALNVLSKVQSQSEVKTLPVPLFMPVQMPVQPEPRRCTREAYCSKQYTEYNRPSQETIYRERPPSYRQALPLPPLSRSQSRARSLVASMSSSTSPPSRTIVHPPSEYTEYRRGHRTGISSSSHHRLPFLRVVSPLHCSEYEYPNTESHPRHNAYQDNDSNVGDVESATHSVLDDYLFMDRDPKPRTLPPPGLPTPPCLMPAPQRLYVRNNGAVSSRPYAIEEDEEETCMTEVNLYDAVADSLHRARKG